MQQLSFNQVEIVSGASRINSYGTDRGGIFSINSLAAASRFASGMGLLYGAYQTGYAFGNLLNEYTPIQSWIASSYSD